MSKIQEFILPKMGESITEGSILNWIVQEGESFNQGDILVEVATDKVDNEVPAPTSGKLIKHLYAAGDQVQIGSAIAQFESGQPTDPSSDNHNQPVKTQPQTQHTSTPPKTPPPPKSITDITPSQTVINRDLFVSSLVDAIARQHHMSYDELARIPATGHRNRLRKSDVFNYLNNGRPYQFTQPIIEPATDPTLYRLPNVDIDLGTGTTIKMDRMRSMIADRMVYSKHTSPHVTTYIEADLTDLVQWRDTYKLQFKNQYGERLTFTPLFIDAVAKAIKQYPDINASVDGHTIILKDAINIGMATALPSGNLIVPVVHNADQKSLPQIAADVNRLAQLARDNKLAGDDIKNGTFTISNVGTFGSLMGTPIINQPEIAVLATGIIKKRAEVITQNGNDTIQIRSMMMLSLSFDHRVVDGYLAGSFLKQVAQNLEQTPDQLDTI